MTGIDFPFRLFLVCVFVGGFSMSFPSEYAYGFCIASCLNTTLGCPILSDTRCCRG